MRFGAFIPQGWRHDLVGIDRSEHWPTMQRLARHIEDLGFESVWVYDHLHPVPVATQEPVYEAWTLMAALATATSRVRLGQMCTCNSYRPPSYLAKVAACIDVMSGGRLEMGIGAGWYEHEYLGYGYEFPKASTRIGMLREGVEIIRRMWTEDEVSYEGKYYALSGALCQPKPLQVPHIPLWVAGGGEQLTLRIAARHADYTNFGYDLDQFRHKSEVLAGHCRELGRPFDQIVRSSNFNVAIGETTADLDDYFTWYRSHFEPIAGAERAEKMIRGNYLEGGGLAGTPDQVVENLREWEASGLEYAIVYFQEAAYDARRMELFARNVMPVFSS
jgi:F420-dependent oxidoreductase-like protein